MNISLSQELFPPDIFYFLSVFFVETVQNITYKWRSGALVCGKEYLQKMWLKASTYLTLMALQYMYNLNSFINGTSTNFGE